MSDSNPPTSDRPTPDRTAELLKLEQQLDRVDELVSLLVDEVIDEPQFRELESLLQENEQTRVRYIEGVQLHCDLLDHFAPEREKLSKPATVLSMLGNPDDSGIHLPLPPTTPGA